MISKLLPINSARRSGKKIDSVDFIVAHDTGNLGSTAEGNVNYYIQSAHEIQASAHYFVDDKQVINCIPENEVAWHVRYVTPVDNQMYMADANDASLGIELCYGGGIDTKKSYLNYVDLIASLCHKYHLDPKTKIVAHSKLDPSRRRDPENAFQLIGKTWEQFLVDVSRTLQALQKSMNKTNWVKFMFSNGHQHVYHTESDLYQMDGGEHGFETAEEALEKSTSEVFIFWDGAPMGAGKLHA